MTDPVIQAAAPELIAMIKALQQFNADMGPDPTNGASTFPVPNSRKPAPLCCSFRHLRRRRLVPA